MPKAKKPKLPAEIQALEVAWRSWFVGCRLELVGQGTWSEVQLPLLVQLVLNAREGRLRLVEAAGEPLVRGSQGQLVSHPSYGVAARCEERAVSLAVRLVLTPDARVRLGFFDGDDRPADPFEALEKHLASRVA